MKLFIVSGRGVVTEAPPLRVRRPAVVGDEVVLVALPAEVQDAMREALASHMQVMRVALAPFGLSPWDISAPVFQRLLREDELKGQ